MPVFWKQNNNILRGSHCIKPGPLLRPLFYKSASLKILNQAKHQKTGNGDGTMGSKSKTKIMKANLTLKDETVQKKSKKENAQDIISKSF